MTSSFAVQMKVWRHKIIKEPRFLQRALAKGMRCVHFLGEWVRYGYCRLTGAPYFGVIHAAAQGVLPRHRYLCGVVQTVSREMGNRPMRILEIGSWAGGSAITWAEALKTYHQGKGSVVCVDPWQVYEEVCQNVAGVYRRMRKALVRNKVFNLFLHNVRATRNGGLVLPFRGSSNDLLPAFRVGSFDIIYVDGAHKYKNVIQDLQNAARLVKDGGIVCGDDLESQAHEIPLQNFSEAELEQDLLFDPQTRRCCHPGVTRAVAEFFGEVSGWAGAWAMCKRGDRWEKLPITEADVAHIALPRHLRS